MNEVIQPGVCNVIACVSTRANRFMALRRSLPSILAQRPRPKKICLVVDRQDQSGMPTWLSNLFVSGRVELLDGDSKYGPHNKYIHAARKYPEDTLVIFDDDVVYRENAVAELLAASLKYPGCVCARRVHRIMYNDDGTCRPYLKWDNQCISLRTPSFDLFATGVGGVLYPPGVLPVSDEALADARKYKNDDIYLKWHENMSGVKVVAAGYSKDPDIYIDDPLTQEGRLYDLNVRQGNNDVEISELGIRRMDAAEVKPVEPEKHVEAPLEKAHDAVAEQPRAGAGVNGGNRTMPFFRVVIPVFKSSDTLNRALQSIRMQTFGDYVVSVCDDGSPEPDNARNRKLVEQLGEKGVYTHTDENRFAGSARNTAMDAVPESAYTLFLDADDTFAGTRVFESLHSFILAHGRPDVVVLPFYNRKGESTFSYARHVTSPEMLAKERIFGTPWAKCVKSSICPRFSEGLRRSNDVMQHYLVVDSARTVVPFTYPVVQYRNDGQTTMFGPAGRNNRKSVHALSCYLKCSLELIGHKWKNEYTKSGVAAEVSHIIGKMAPSLVGELGVGGIRNFFK